MRKGEETELCSLEAAAPPGKPLRTNKEEPEPPRGTPRAHRGACARGAAECSSSGR